MSCDTTNSACGKSAYSTTLPETFGAVAIGRNEGDRLATCLDSLLHASAVVYVDSDSSDGSMQMARNRGIEVVELDLSIPFTAARARNAGFERLQTLFPNLQYVQFVDGDCELIEGWTNVALSFLESRRDVAAVCGRLRERHPERSIYNWLCDKEWDRPIGEVDSFAGNVMIRAQALHAVSGYREDVIAAEEDELCVRLRARNWKIWRLSHEMALHDAAMTHFGQWWRRSFRAGYAFAQGTYLHGATPERHFVWESRRAWILGLLLPLLCIILGVLFHPFGWIVLLLYPLQLLYKITHLPGPLRDRTKLALFHLLARFPESLGQITFLLDRLLRRQAQLIEHK